MSGKMSGKITHNQWLKYKFGGPGGLKKIGALLSVEGVLGNLLVPFVRQQFYGARNGFPPRSPLL